MLWKFDLQPGVLYFERLVSHMRLISKFRVRSAAPFVSPFCSTACIRFISSLQDVHTVSVCLTSSPRSNVNLPFICDCNVYSNKGGIPRATQPGIGFKPKCIRSLIMYCSVSSDHISVSSQSLRPSNSILFRRRQRCFAGDDHAPPFGSNQRGSTGNITAVCIT